MPQTTNEGLELVIEIRPGQEDLSPLNLTKSLAVAGAPLSAAGVPRIRPTFLGATKAQLDELWERVVRADPTYKGPRLSRFFSLQFDGAPDAHHVAAIRHSILSLPSVARAYPARQPVSLATAVPPGPIQGYDPNLLLQVYLDRAPEASQPDGGVDARSAWLVPGGTGDGITLCDVEDGWTLDHEAIAAKEIRLDGENHSFRGHGAAVLGIVAGGGSIRCNTALPTTQSKQQQLLGVAPCARVVALSVRRMGREDRSLGDALARLAIDNPFNLVPGDVVLLEQQTNLNGGLAPVETEPHLFHALRQLIIDKQLVVIEAAGNSGLNLDDQAFEWRASGEHPFNRSHARFVDSGAILVAASSPLGRCDPQSNHGSRIDCFAQGFRLATCGDGAQSTATSIYINNFGDTSGATAILAGVAVAVQGMVRQSGAAPLTSRQMRALLSDPESSIPASDPTKHIGRMPDLKKIIAALEARGVQPSVMRTDD